MLRFKHVDIYVVNKFCIITFFPYNLTYCNFPNFGLIEKYY